MPTIGLLYPGHSAEDDYPQLEARLGSDLRLPLVHTSVGEDAHRVDALLDLGGTDRLAEGARVLVEQHSPDVVMWACTSGSFVFGWEGAHQQVAELQEVTGLPTSSTSLAFVAACRALGVTRVSVAASYPQDVAEHFVDFLGHGGVDVTAMGSHGIITAAEVGTLGQAEVLDIVRGADTSGGAEAILVPDTAMHTLAWLESLEHAAGVPVLTANQVTVWQGLSLLGEVPVIDSLGTLFSSRRGD
ncbi:maleate cis-trans isomerase family protein [Ornithinimicrobium faecis]|uniref:maleate cis-trans isomerase family protein n=1 Tax=Ornithinimicrobium faecis TaxID=2934158 RepID=UPI002119550B|nr:maleate cis-trans isomerase [Ornithinimicrobium sp. HY1745]